MEIPHLSYSQIYTYLQCAKQWEALYLQKVESTTDPALLFGGAVHNTIEGYLRNKNQSILELWSREWVDILSNEKKVVDWGEKTPNEMLIAGQNIFNHDETLEMLDGLKVARCTYGLPSEGEEDEGFLLIEKKIEITLPKMPPIIGYIDCITDDGVPMDFKTSAYSWPAGKAQKELQPLFYLLAMDQQRNEPWMAGLPFHEYKFRHFVVTKTKTPKVMIIESQRSMQEVKQLVEMVEVIWRSMKTKVYTPNPTSWKCNASCPVWADCAGRMIS